MIDHLGLDVSDLDRSRRFYEAALAPLGFAVVSEVQNEAGGRIVMFGVAGVPEFVIAQDKTPGPGTHVAFRAERGPRSTPSTPRPWPPAAATTARRACAPSMAPTTTPPSPATPTG